MGMPLYVLSVNIPQN